MGAGDPPGRTAAGQPALAEDSSLQMVWRNTEVRSPGSVADALLKLRQLGLPLEVLLERLGESPQSILRIMGLAAEEQAQTAASQASKFGA